MIAACKDNSEVTSCGFSNHMRMVCKKSYLNRQTCRQKHTDPFAQQIHTGTAYNEDIVEMTTDKKLHSGFLHRMHYIGQLSIYVVHSVKDSLDMTLI